MIKVSEYASWSIRYYKRIIDGCLDAVGAPRDLVQFVVGYGATGSALVTSGVDKVTIFSYSVLCEIYFYPQFSITIILILPFFIFHLFNFASKR